MKLKDALPELYDEVFELIANKAGDLLQQLPHLTISERCHCGESECSTFSVKGAESPLSAQMQKDRGRYLTDAIDLDAETGMIVVDLDHIRRIKSFEIRNRADVGEKLSKLFNG